jgi:hypothetical protein
MADKLKRSLAVMTATGANFVSHDYLRVSGDGGESTISCAGLFSPGKDNFHTLYRKGFIATSTVVCERKLLTAAGDFDVTLPNAQDFDLWLRALAPPNARLHVFGEALCRYHVMASSVSESTDRRVAACMRVALRHFDVLKMRAGNPWSSLWYRIAAIHWEALNAHAARGRWYRVLATVSALPGRLAFATLSAGEDPAHPRRLEWLMTAWVVGVFALYLAQFRELIGPVLAAFGIG